VGPPADRAYLDAGLGGRLDGGSRPAVVVVDLISAFTDPDHPLGADLDRVVLATRELLEHARAARRPVIFTTIAFQEGLADAGRWPEKIPALNTLVIGSRWVRVDERLQPRGDEPLVVKKGASAVFGTNLVALLIHRAIDTVVLCGATTSGCVRATAVDLLQLGFAVLVPAQCVGDRSSAGHDASLCDLDAKYADVVELGSAIACLGARGC
jgi:maleamate amidohydrolase